MVSDDVRSAFDLPRGEAYLNAAQIGPMPRAAVQAGEAAFQEKARPWTRTTGEKFFDRPEALRAEAARLFETSAENLALVPSASYGLAVAARNLTPAPGAEMLVLEDQFPSNVYAWRALAQRTGAQVRAVPRRQTETWTEALLAAITERTALVACGALHWIDGGRIDLEAVSKAAKARGAALVLDLTQSLGVMPFDVGAADPDFAVTAAYKWLLGPYAIGFLYAAPRRQDGVPLEENWINREGAEDFTRLTDYRDGYAPGARRFDMGERSNHQLVPAATASLAFLNAFGASRAASQCAEATAALAEAAAPFGLRDDTPDRAGHYLSLGLPGEAPSDLAARLRALGVHVSQRGPRLRVAPHVYTDETDIARFADALRTVLG